MASNMKRTIGGKEYRLFKSAVDLDYHVSDLASRIYAEHKDDKQPPILLFVLTGGIYFGVDLSRCLNALGLPHAIDTIGLRRYAHDREGRNVEITSQPRSNFGGRRVIVVEDIVDEGPTMNFLNTLLSGHPTPPSTLEYCVLGLRENRANCVPLEFEIRYLGFMVPDGWLVGYGMDAEQDLRGEEVIWIEIL